MAHLLSRRNSADRVFPAPDTDPFNGPAKEPDLSADQRAARLLLAQGSVRLPLAHRLGWRGRDPLVRLLFLQRQAVQAELAGQLPRADFWWQQRERQWQALPGEHPAWRDWSAALLRQTGAVVLASPEGLRSTLARELLLDTHLALSNGCLTDAEARRATLHLKQAHQLSPVAGLSEEERQELEEPPGWWGLDRALEGANWAEVVAVARGFAEQIRGRPEAEARLGSLLFRQVHDAAARGDWDVALTLAEGLGACFPADALCRDLAVRVHVQAVRTLKKGSWPRALEWADRLARRCPDDPTHAARRMHLRMQAIASLTAGGLARCSGSDWDQAISLAAELARDFPQHLRFARQLRLLCRQAADFHRQAGRPEQALAFTARLVRLAPEDVGARAELERAYRDRVRPLKKKEKWKQLAGEARAVLGELPAWVEPLDDLAEAVLGEANAALPVGGSKEEIGRHKAAQTQAPIAELERLLAEVPHAYPAYRALGLLYAIQAGGLFTGDRPAQALLALALAQAYAPDLEQVREGEAIIERNLADYRRQLDQLPCEVRNQLRAGGPLPYHLRVRGLTQDSLDLLRDVESGTEARDRFRRSGEVERIERARQRARARHFWLRVGLPQPEGDWDELARAFDEATDRLMERKPGNAVELLSAWLEIAGERPELLSLDITKVVGFFCKRTQTEPGEAAGHEPEEPAGQEAVDELPPDPDSPTEEELVPAERRVVPAEEARPAPVLRCTRADLGIKLEPVPWDFWLFSARDVWVKGLMASAALLVALSGGLTWFDRAERGKRAGAFADLQRAAHDLDEPAAQEAARRYHAARSLSVAPGQAAEVDRLLARVHSGLRQRARQNAFDRMNALVQRPAWQRDHRALALAAEDFLGALAEGDRDEKLSRVLRWYDEVVGDWLTALEGPVSADVEERLKRYRALVLAPGRKETQP